MMMLTMTIGWSFHSIITVSPETIDKMEFSIPFPGLYTDDKMPAMTTTDRMPIKNSMPD